MDNKNLTKEQVRGILDNAPANLDKKVLLQRLVEKGYVLEGFNAPQPTADPVATQEGTKANDFLGQSAAKQIFSKNFLKELPGAAYETVVGGALKFIKSAVEAPRDIVATLKGNEIPNTPGTDPVTGKTITTIQSDFQQKVPEVLAGERTPLNAVGGAVADTVLGAADTLGAEGLVKGAVKVGEIAVDKVKNLVEASKKFTLPKLPPGGGGSGVAKTVGNVIEDVIPKAADLRDRTIAKALRLAPVEDISVIKQSTGNDIGEFMNRYELVKDTPAETLSALSKFKKDNFNMVRDAVALVENKFTFNDVPQMKDTLDFLEKDLVGRKSPEYVQALNKVKELQSKEEFDLLEVQYVKNLFDDIESIYKRTGDVRDAVAAQDKAQTIAPIRRFIEERVQEVYPQIDIRALNNNVQTSSAIIDATLKRAPKADTASFFHLGDLGVLGVGNMQTPGLGYGALFAKKVFESSPIQLRLSRFFAGKVKADELFKGLTPDKLKEIETFLSAELKDAMVQDDHRKIQEIRDALAKARGKAQPK